MNRLGIKMVVFIKTESSLNDKKNEVYFKELISDERNPRAPEPKTSIYSILKNY